MRTPEEINTIAGMLAGGVSLALEYGCGEEDFEAILDAVDEKIRVIYRVDDESRVAAVAGLNELLNTLKGARE